MFFLPVFFSSSWLHFLCCKNRCFLQHKMPSTAPDIKHNGPNRNGHSKTKSVSPSVVPYTAWTLAALVSHNSENPTTRGQSQFLSNEEADYLGEFHKAFTGIPSRSLQTFGSSDLHLSLPHIVIYLYCNWVNCNHKNALLQCFESNLIQFIANCYFDSPQYL